MPLEVDESPPMQDTPLHDGALPDMTISEPHETKHRLAEPEVTHPSISEDQLPPDPAALQGGRFLHDRNPRLHASTEVEDVANYLRASGDKIPNEPAHKINAYLGFLANEGTVNDGILTGDAESIQRQVETRVIKVEEVPEAYFDFRRRIARERGYGDVTLTAHERDQEIEAIQADQRASLTKWVDYLSGGDSEYPDWFKHYAWNAVTKLGAFVKKHDDAGKVIESEFLNRSRGTTTPYPELNREALAYVYDVLNKSRIQGEKVDGGRNDEKLQKLLQGANFGKLYAHAILEVTPDSVELRKHTEGSWTKFDQTNDPKVAERLSKSLQGHGTGWCTAGESMAEQQLALGDFYVYYSRDNEGKDTVPRVAIRMEDGKVAEVRGINAGQEMEPEMVDIATEQFTKLPGGKEYARKAEDMRQMTAIEKRLAANSNAELTTEEVRFLYELDHPIEGFGYDRDVRIDKARMLRGERDIAEVSRLMSEVLHRQLQSSYKAYEAVMTVLDSGLKHEKSNNELTEDEMRQKIDEALRRMDLGLPSLDASKPANIISERQLEDLFAQKDQEWRQSGVYDYLAEQQVRHNNFHTLVITPNVDVDLAGITNLAEGFHDTYIHTSNAPKRYMPLMDLGEYARDNYTPRQLSGTSGDAPVRMSLVPIRPVVETTEKTVIDQRKILQGIQERQPALHIRIPSLLENVSYWYSLQENKRYFGWLTPQHMREYGIVTEVVHIDLPSVTILNRKGEPEQVVPYSRSRFYDAEFLSLDIDESLVQARRPMRIAVG